MRGRGQGQRVQGFFVTVGVVTCRPNLQHGTPKKSRARRLTLLLCLLLQSQFRRRTLQINIEDQDPNETTENGLR